MSYISLLEKKPQFLSFEPSFLQELVEQFHSEDSNKVYQDWSDHLLLEFFIYSDQIGKPFDLDYLNQLLISSFYHAIAKLIEQKTGYVTETFVHVKNQSYSSAVIFCGGVLVVYSLIRFQEKYSFDSSEQMLQEAKKIIEAALAKANPYLDFAA